MARGKGLARQAHQPRVDNEEAPPCPLCIEPLDAHEQDWFPCACGYQVCAFCYQRLQLENNNQCPGCRTEYGTQPVAGPRTEAKAKASPVRRAGRAAENGHPSPGAGQAGASGASPRGRRVRSAEAVKPLALPLLAKQLPDRPAAATARSARGHAPPPEPPKAAPEPPEASQLAAPEASPATAAEERDGEAGPAPAHAPAWGLQQPAAAAAARPPPPSPTKWPELGTLPQPAAGVAQPSSLQPPPAEGLGPPPAAQPSLAAQPPQPPPRQPQQPQRAAGDEAGAAPSPARAPRKLPTELLWSLLLAAGAPPQDARGCSLRLAVQQAVSSGALNSRTGAARLAAYLQSAAQPRRPPLAEPRPNGLPAASGGLQQGKQRGGGELPTSHHLQSGVEAALGLGPGGGGGQPAPATHGPGTDLWAKLTRQAQQQPALPPQQQAGSAGGGGGGGGGDSLLWAGRRQDADRVPDALQELWANPAPRSNGGGQSAAYGGHCRGLGDPLEALPRNGGLYASPYAASQLPPPAASHALSQGVSAGLGLGGAGGGPQQPASSYLQGVRAALEYGLPPGYGPAQPAAASQPAWAQQLAAGGQQAHLAGLGLSGAQAQAPWGLPELTQASYAQAGGQPGGLQPPPGWAGYSAGLGSRLYHQ